jgi:hypothetical protein
MRAIEAEIRTFTQRYGFETGQFQKAKQGWRRCRLPPRRANCGAERSCPRRRAVERGWQQLRGRFTVAYPGNWQVYGDQQSSMATIAPREGLVQGSNGSTQVGYGAILSYFSPSGRTDLRNATSQLVSRLRADNPTMQVASRTQKRVRIGRSDGLVTMLESSSPYGGTETDALLTVARPEGLFYMVFIAPERNFGQLEGTFQQMINSLQFAN